MSRRTLIGVGAGVVGLAALTGAAGLGYSDDHRNAFGTDLGLDRFLAQSVKNGSRPFAIASIDGGDTYWHKRASGEDAGAMVVDEFLPLLAEQRLDTSRVGLYGWSMGGYGALHLAGRLGPERVSSVVAVSPALWHTAGEAAHIAFDGAADFAANTPFGHEAALAGVPVRIDCGTGDGFYPAVRDYVSGVKPRPAGGFTPGGHDADYWLQPNSPSRRTTSPRMNDTRPQPLLSTSTQDSANT